MNAMYAYSMLVKEAVKCEEMRNGCLYETALKFFDCTEQAPCLKTLIGVFDYGITVSVFTVKQPRAYDVIIVRHVSYIQ